MRHRTATAAVTSAVVAVILVITMPAYATDSVGQPVGAQKVGAHKTVGSPRSLGSPTVELSVMSQNIFYGGDDHDLTERGNP